MGRSSVLVSAGLVILGTYGLGACAAGGPENAGSGSQSMSTSVNVVTSRNDVNRTSANPNESILTTQNVRAATFGKVFTRPLDGQVYAQPLLVSGVNGKNLVFVATEHNSIYAFDSDDMSATAAPIWQKSFGAPVPATDTGCGLLGPEIGITSTPVIDPQTKTMWFTTKNKEAGKFIHRLHAIDIATGNERANSPSQITAQAPGDGDGSVGGVLTMDPLKHMNRPGLLKVGNRIYIGFASNCDIGPYHGWVLGYDATTLQQTAVHVDTPNGEEGGIWHAGVGLASDESGDVYYVSGNGTFDGQKNFGNSMVRLKDNGSTLSVKSFFTPFDSQAANDADLDIGSTGGMLLPGTNLFVAGDKRGTFYLTNRDQMGSLVTTTEADDIVQRFQATTKGAFGGAAFYKTAASGAGIYYIWGTGDRLKAFKFDGTKFVLPALVNTNTLIGYPGGQVSVSSNGQAPGSAILWAVRGKRTNSGLAASVGSGVLQAFDANDITQQLWSSDDSAADVLGDATKFAPPTIVNGRVFVGTSSNQLVVYGLKNGNPVTGGPDAGAGPGAGPATAPGVAGTPTFTKIYNEVLGPNTPGHCSGTGGCHTNIRGGFKCGTTKASCFQGLVDAGLINPQSPAQSTLVSADESPLAWLGGGMPLDNQDPNPAAAALLKAWIAGGAKNN
jgi:hypothetical protein